MKRRPVRPAGFERHAHRLLRLAGVFLFHGIGQLVEAAVLPT
jgi:hypothetical protein